MILCSGSNVSEQTQGVYTVMRILVIIPCFNEEKSIHDVIDNIMRHAENDFTYNMEIDYLVINDCSTDSTLQMLQENRFHFLNLPVNLGIGGCMQAGFLYAHEKGYDIAIQHDGDGQHDVAFFADVIGPIKNGEADIVIGSRFIENEGFQSSGIRRLGINLLSGIIKICTGRKLNDVTSGYRAINKKYIKFFSMNYAQDYPEPESIVDAIRNGAVICEVPVIMQERKEGKSSIGALKSVYYMIKVSLAILLHRVIISQRTPEDS